MIVTNHRIFQVAPIWLVDKMIRAENVCESISEQIVQESLKCLDIENPCLIVLNNKAYVFSRDELIRLEPIEGQLIDNLAEKMIKHQKEENKQDIIPLLVYFDNESHPAILGVAKPEKHIIKEKKSRTIPKESELEDNLMIWLKSHGINCESQAKIKNGRTDIWIPGVCFIELKTGTITAKDVCQVLNYYCETKRKILLVGKSVSKDVVLAIENVNTLADTEAVVFVSWSTIYVYLRGLLGIN